MITNKRNKRCGRIIPPGIGLQQNMHGICLCDNEFRPSRCRLMSCLPNGGAKLNRVLHRRGPKAYVTAFCRSVSSVVYSGPSTAL